MSRIPRDEPRIDVDVKDIKPGADVPTVVHLDNNSRSHGTASWIDNAEKHRGQKPFCVGRQQASRCFGIADGASANGSIAGTPHSSDRDPAIQNP
jgi:hypothetical protein